VANAPRFFDGAWIRVHRDGSTFEGTRSLTGYGSRTDLMTGTSRRAQRSLARAPTTLRSPESLLVVDPVGVVWFVAVEPRQEHLVTNPAAAGRSDL
jgi:hypothetical protein